MLALIKTPAPRADVRGIEPDDYVATLVTGTPTLLNFHDILNARKIVRRPFESEAFEFERTELGEPIERFNW
ncbi:hypothetical protein D3C87_1952000 [compost metagenome]